MRIGQNEIEIQYDAKGQQFVTIRPLGGLVKMATTELVTLSERLLIDQIRRMAGSHENETISQEPPKPTDTTWM